MAQPLPSVLFINNHILYMPHLHLDKQHCIFEVTLYCCQPAKALQQIGLVCCCDSKVHTLAQLRINFLSIIIAAVAMIL